MLNRHIQRVAEAERERALAEDHHRTVSRRMVIVSARVKQLEKEYSRSIKKSRHYFDQREEFRRIMDHQKALIKRLELEVRFLIFHLLYISLETHNENKIFRSFSRDGMILLCTFS